MTADIDANQKFVLAVLVVFSSSLVGGYHTFGAFADTETTEGGLSAANDLTVDLGQLQVEPGSVEPGETVTVRTEVPNPDAVEATRFTLHITGSEERVLIADSVTCDRLCEVKFSTDKLRGLDNGTGTYQVTLRGWWEYERDFVATGTLTLMTPEESGSNSVTTAEQSTTEVTDQTPNGTTTTTSRTTNVTTTETAEETTTTTTAETTEETTTTTTTTTIKNVTSTTTETSTTTTTS